MGQTLVYVPELDTINFDRLAAMAIQLIAINISPEELVFVRTVPEGVTALDIEGDLEYRDYDRQGGRSMTELLAIDLGLAKSKIGAPVAVESELPGLVKLCEAIALNHGKVWDERGKRFKPGGRLYREVYIADLAKNLKLLPIRALEIAKRIVTAVMSAVRQVEPISALVHEAVTTPFWGEMKQALADAERQTYDRACEVVREIRSGKSTANGYRFALKRAGKAQPKAEGIVVKTSNPNLMKHAWAELRQQREIFRVATAVVVHPENGRIAVLCSAQEDVSIERLVAELKERFPDAKFNVNEAQKTIVWDPRFCDALGPDADLMEVMVAAHLAVHDPKSPERRDAPISSPQSANASGPAAGALKVSIMDRRKHRK